MSIKKIKLFPSHFKNQAVKIKAWIKSNRKIGKIGFLVVNDGTTLDNLQLIYRQDLINFETISKLLTGSAIVAEGELVKAKNDVEKIELIVHKITIINATAVDYFLQKKKHSNEFLRIKSELRARSRYFYAIFKIRSVLSLAIHRFFARENFLYLQSPILTNNDCEGAGESLIVNDCYEKNKLFFKNNATLSVSGQLHAEAFAQTYQKVYTFGPTFRADKSNTTVHASEFWMVEPEIAFANRNDGIALAEKLIKNIVQDVYLKCWKEVEFLAKENQVDLCQKLESLVKKKFIRISYTEAINLLNQRGGKKVVWGADLNKEHERFLCHNFNAKPIFITDYPHNIKAFYMKQNHDQKTVACFDLLFPDIGEVVGGSEREDNYEKLIQSLTAKKISALNLKWYLDLRQQGYGGSTGFGLGLDRLLMYITGVENIRDVIPFYCGFKTLNY